MLYKITFKCSIFLYHNFVLFFFIASSHGNCEKSGEKILLLLRYLVTITAYRFGIKLESVNNFHSLQKLLFPEQGSPLKSHPWHNTSHRPVLLTGDLTFPSGRKKACHVEEHTPAHVPHLHVHPNLYTSFNWLPIIHSDPSAS